MNDNEDFKTLTVREKIQSFLEYVEPGSDFTIRDIYDALSAKGNEEKAAVRKAVSRERESGTIESSGKYGSYRKIDKSVEFVDLSMLDDNAGDCFNVSLPGGLENQVKIYPGDLIIYAGLTNCGKSSACLQTAYMNCMNHPVTYFSSELTPKQIQERAQISGIKLESLRGINFAMRYDSYQDVITSDSGICIIDYLAAPGSGDEAKYFAIPHLISKIHNKLNGRGLLIIALQKDPGNRSGEGGFKTLHRSNLYLTLDKDGDANKYWMNVQKCKAKSSLEGYRLNYKLKPFGLEPLSDWMPPKQKPMKKTSFGQDKK